MTDTLIRHVTAITLDSKRRVLEDAAIAIKDDRIVAVGPDLEVSAMHGQAIKVIDGRCMAAIPGLIDCHSHAGHGLIRSLGAGDGHAWFNACAEIYARGSTVEFWRSEARLAQLERLKAGVTTCLTLLGGGADVYRTDDPVFGDAHCQATRESGLRTILAVGPGQRPFPQRFSRVTQDGFQDFDISFKRQLEVSDMLIRRWNDVRTQRTGICLIMPVYRAADLTEPDVRTEIQEMSHQVAALRSAHNVLFTQDGHRDGSIAVARDLGLLGPFALLSHSVDLTSEDIGALKQTGTNVVHNPSAIMSVYGRCPAPELIEEGVTVCMGSDATAPDRGFDMFRHMTQCMHYHRRHFRDPAWMPPGKVLEMTTIDAARALGLDDVIGSLEVGKKADIVLVDMKKPHLYPPNMPVTRLAHFANAADVDTVIVDGAVLLSQRKPVMVDEEEILEAAEAELALTLTRTGLQALTNEPEDFWGVNRRLNKDYPIRK
jgi:cytosine/adenosine deaminase-related metal-dependent hydrolase